MANSSEYNNLNTGINSLSGLLPAVNVTGSYSVLDQNLTRSYLVMCHAEIESYLESVVLSGLNSCFSRWQLDKTNVLPVIFNLLFNYKGNESNVESKVHKAYQEHVRLINKNNGIKDNNIIKLLKPIGFAMDNTLQTSLTSFGSRRGQIVHNSFSPSHVSDPISEKNQVQLLLQGLKTFDEELLIYFSTDNRSKIVDIKLGHIHRFLKPINSLLMKLFKI